MVDNQSVSDGPDIPSGNPDDNQTQVQPEQNVSYETHRKLLGQRKRDQVELDELRSFRAQSEQDVRLKEEKELTAKGEFQKINTSKDQRIQELEARITERERHDAEALKVDAVLRALPGPLKRREYAAHIKVEDILVDPTTGQIDEHSLKEASDNFAKDYGDLIQTRQDIPTLPSGAPGRPMPQQTIDNMSTKQLKSLLPDLFEKKIRQSRSQP